MEPLGYVRWENFLSAISRAVESCRTTGHDAENHFRGVTKMVELGSNRQGILDGSNRAAEASCRGFLGNCPVGMLEDEITDPLYKTVFHGPEKVGLLSQAIEGPAAATADYVNAYREYWDSGKPKGQP